jgi:hypothetical protein
LVAIAIVFFVLVLALLPGKMLSRIVLFAPGGVPRFPVGIQPIVEPIVENVTMFLLIYLALWALLRLFSKRPFWTLGWETDHAFSRVLLGIAAAGIMMAAVAGISIASGASRGPGLIQTMGLAAVGLRFLSLLSYFVQGPAEEALFRGWLMPVIGARYRPWIGVIVSSAIFSLAHSTSQGITALGFLNLFLFGVLTSAYALADGGLWGVGAWHAVWNWMQGDLLGFPTDGSPHIGLLSSVQANGPGLITGGAFGPEGGLACTAIFLIAIGIIWTIRNIR